MAQRGAQHTIHTKANIGAHMDQAQHEHPGVLGVPAWVNEMDKSGSDYLNTSVYGGLKGTHAEQVRKLQGCKVNR